MIALWAVAGLALAGALLGVLTAIGAAKAGRVRGGCDWCRYWEGTVCTCDRKCLAVQCAAEVRR